MYGPDAADAVSAVGNDDPPVRVGEPARELVRRLVFQPDPNGHRVVAVMGPRKAEQSSYAGHHRPVRLCVSGSWPCFALAHVASAKLLAMLDRIRVDPKVCEGKATIRGLRITVDFVLKLLGDGYDANEIVREYPELEREDVLQAAKYGAWLASERVSSIA